MQGKVFFCGTLWIHLKDPFPRVIDHPLSPQEFVSFINVGCFGFPDGGCEMGASNKKGKELNFKWPLSLRLYQDGQARWMACINNVKSCREQLVTDWLVADMRFIVAALLFTTQRFFLLLLFRKWRCMVKDVAGYHHTCRWQWQECY